MVPTLKFSLTTSACLTSSRKSSTPAGVFRSRVTPSLLRSRYCAAGTRSSTPSRCRRTPSETRSRPRSGDSTLITRAPMSASSIVQKGIAMTWPRSSTVTSSSAWSMAGAAVAGRGSGRGAVRRAGPEAAGQIAAVHREGVAGDVAGVVGGEEERDPGDFLGLAEAAHRDALHPAAPRLFRQGPGEPRVDLGRGDRVHRDAVLRQLHRHGAGQLDDAGLGRVVPDQVLDAAEAVDRRGGDDPTAAALPDHLAGRGLAAEEDAGQGGAQDARPLGPGVLEERRGVGDAR